MEHIKSGPGLGNRSHTIVGSGDDVAQLKAEVVLLKRKNERLQKKEKRIQVKKDPKNKNCKSNSPCLTCGC